jgi:ubiquinol-cytochrome c reductase cytochrome c subunit
VRRLLPSRRVSLVAAVVCAAGALASIALSGGASAQDPGAQPAPAVQESAAQVARGRALYVDSCSSCHGLDARGVEGRGPSLHGVGARASDFYLSTGRMPLDDPGDEPERHPPAFERPDIDALNAYVGSLGGPPIPRADPARGNISEGQRLFADHCSGCHQIMAQGGIITGAQVPDLSHATPTEIAEAIRIGPYLMPKFGEAAIDQHQLDSIANYVDYTRHPNDAGGWSLGHIGPIPEGMVTWLLAIVALLFVIRLIGERTTE